MKVYAADDLNIPSTKFNLCVNLDLTESHIPIQRNRTYKNFINNNVKETSFKL
jgi:hypothetical protein